MGVKMEKQGHRSKRWTECSCLLMILLMLVVVMIVGHVALSNCTRQADLAEDAGTNDAISNNNNDDKSQWSLTWRSVLWFLPELSFASTVPNNDHTKNAAVHHFQSLIWDSTLNQHDGSEGQGHFVAKESLQGQGRRQVSPEDRAASCSVPVTDRFDCYPDKLEPKAEECESRGCCYDNAPQEGTPPCFFSTTAAVTDGYQLISLTPIYIDSNVVGLNATLTRSSRSAFPNDIMTLSAVLLCETRYRAHFKIYDATAQRYEVPLDLNDDEPPIPMQMADYTVNIGRSPFSITITRNSTGQILFDTTGMAPLIFADQFLQIGTRLSSSVIYGLGEHRSSLAIDTNWQKFIFWSRDQPPAEHTNLYGHHPFYLNFEQGRNAHGVFLLNSNAMQVDLQPYNQTGAITYRSLGGVLDFFIFLGPSPDEVVQQYVTLIGLPFMPPFWALGFHLCRHGYDNSSNFWNIIQRNRAANIPYDVQWNDLDYSAGSRIWTWDNDTYRGLPGIIANLHAHGQHYIIIVDPVVASDQPASTYPAWDRGEELGVFIRNSTGQILLGQLWPGPAAFVDFFHPNTFDYWLSMIVDFHKVLAFDGLWIDMNEPSNFVNGSIYGCGTTSIDNPPFVPQGIKGGTLYANSVCPSAQQSQTGLHYNLHSLFGWSETVVTMMNLQVYYQKRTLVISRSTAPGSGRFGGHWTGDNFSSFKDMYFSIPAILNFNMFGMPLVGADICGFIGNTTRELCIRWMQLGSFYSFTRNHAEYETTEQDPGVWDSEAQGIMRSALRKRYSLLPYLYTLLFRAHRTGLPVLRPLFFDYPGTERIDRQFLWGHDLLISPVLEEGADSVQAYIPKGSWYDLDDLTLLNVSGSGITQLAAPLEKINTHVRGGSIVPMLEPAVTTTQMRQGNMELLVALDVQSGSGSAEGQLFWDDGEVLDLESWNTFTLVNFTLSKNTLTSKVWLAKYSPVTLGKVTVLGVIPTPTKVTMNGQAASFSYNSTAMVLKVEGLSVNLLSPFKMTWQ